MPFVSSEVETPRSLALFMRVSTSPDTNGRIVQIFCLMLSSVGALATTRTGIALAAGQPLV